jgi:hypothetical protein
MSIIGRIKSAFGATSDFFMKRSRKPNRTNKTLLDRVYSSEYHEYHGFREFREMLSDPQVKVGYLTLVQFLLSREVIVTSASDDPGDVEARQFVEDALKGTKTPFRTIMKNIYTAIPYGFSASEIVYKIDENGLISIDDFYPIHRATLDHDDAFVFDDNDNLTHIRQRINYGLEEPIPIEKVLLFSYDSEFNDPEGNSILEELYDTVFIKSQVLKWLAVYLQKHESPTLVGKVSDPTYKDDMREQMEDVEEGRTQITIGKEDEVFVLESSHRGEAFFNSIKYHDDVIFRRFFLGTLLFGQASGGGAYAQSQTQFDVTKLVLDGINKDISTSIQEKTDNLVKLNYSVAKPPKISFTPFEDKDIVRLLEMLKPYVDNLTVDADAEWFKELISQAVEELSGVKVDKAKITREFTPSGSMEQIPGSETSPLEEELKALLP